MCHLSGQSPTRTANPTSVAQVKAEVTLADLSRRGRSQGAKGRPSTVPAAAFHDPGAQDEIGQYVERGRPRRGELVSDALSALFPEDRLCPGSVMVNEPFPQSFPVPPWNQRVRARLRVERPGEVSVSNRQVTPIGSPRPGGSPSTARTGGVASSDSDRRPRSCLERRSRRTAGYRSGASVVPRRR